MWRPFRNKDTGRRRGTETGFPAARPLLGRGGFRVFLMCCLCCGACGGGEGDGHAYPSLLTGFVEIHTDAGGTGTRFVTDDGKTYAINSPIRGLQPDTAYRLVCGYEVTAGYRAGCPVAKVYTVEAVNLLKPEEGPPDNDDPLAVASIWDGGNYLNLHLSPKTQGGTQEWGYRTDSTRPSPTGTVYHLSLCHRQGGDPYSYSTTVYASLPLRPLGLREGDSIAFAVLTFDGRKTWWFGF